MVKNSKGVYFLSRPRRFGKSLTLSTLKEIFEGNKDLFEGLFIYDAKYDWKKYPTIRIDFSAMKTFVRELINLAREKNFEIQSLPIEIGEMSFSTYEVENLQVVPLLFQTGYLTLKGFDSESMLYTLDYPNYEVKNAVLTYFTNSWTGKESSESYIHKFITSLRQNDFENFFIIFRSIFSNIYYDLHIPQEKYYQRILYLIFTIVGLRVFAEVKTNIGRIDIVIEDRGSVFLFEFKFNGTKEEALAQIKKNKYFEKYFSPHLGTHDRVPVRLFGVEFTDKTVGEWMMEEL